VSKFFARARHLPLDLSSGYEPWQPPGTVRLAVFRSDSGAPVDGVFLFGQDQRYLFTRVGYEPLRRTGLYAYVPLSRRMLRRLQHAGDGYDRLRDRCLARRGVAYATAAGAGAAQRITGRPQPREQVVEDRRADRWPGRPPRARHQRRA
jgi:hypothetical protein